MVVVSWKRNEAVGDARTLRELLSPMIDDARRIYERLYQIEVGASVTIVFKLARKLSSRSNTKGQEVTSSDEVEREVPTMECGETTDCVESISVLCKNEHPYLNKDVWLDTRGLMDSTFLKGNIFLLSLMFLHNLKSWLNDNLCPFSQWYQWREASHPSKLGKPILVPKQARW